MSEYQYIAFRAIDRPVSKTNLAYMRRQSSRAEITPLSFNNEYNFGNFRGNAIEMLRRGYDLHLHYANFGIRRLLIRLPRGLPDPKAAKPYFAKDSLQFLKDKNGPGGILSIEPFHEPGDHEELWDIADLVDELIPLRAEILDGDLRPLYLAHLALACDGEHDPDETTEGPIPAGLGKLSDAQAALLKLYGISDFLIAAAARGSPQLAKQDVQDDPRKQYAQWLQSQSEAAKDAWLAQWMADPHSTVRSEILASFQEGRNIPGWPTTLQGRTIAELEATAAEIHAAANRKSAEKSARNKVKRLAKMAADPGITLRETEQLVKQRTTAAYRKISKLLVELREALAESSQSGLAEHQAQKLRKENTSCRGLVSELRREGLLSK